MYIVKSVSIFTKVTRKDIYKFRVLKLLPLMSWFI